MNRVRLSASYGAFSLDVEASWSARSVALFGASGSGKSTVLEAIAGLRPEESISTTSRSPPADSVATTSPLPSGDQLGFATRPGTAVVRQNVGLPSERRSRSTGAPVARSQNAILPLTAQTAGW